MALFGAPSALEDAPRRAVHAALAMQDRVSTYAGELRGRGLTSSSALGSTPVSPWSEASERIP